MSRSSYRLPKLSPERQVLLHELLGEDPKAAPEKAARQASDAVRLSFAQERLWFLDRLQPGLSVYNLATAMALGGGIDAGVVERCINEIVRRHEALRTTFRV